MLRRLPPSVTDSGTAAEIKYSLKVVVKSSDGLFAAKLKRTREILYLPLSASISPRPSCAKRQYLNIDPQASGLPEPLPWQIDAELLNGPCFCVGQHIPLIIKLTKLCGEHCKIWLNEFQTMLIETTQAHAHGSVETLDQFWTVQTVANMKQRLCAENTQSGSVIDIPEAVWASHPLPAHIIPSFEVCNIKRTYELELRLGLKMGSRSAKVRPPTSSLLALCSYLTTCHSQTQTIIREFRFPVCIVATKFPETWLLSCSSLQSSLNSQQTPSLGYHGRGHGHDAWKEIG